MIESIIFYGIFLALGVSAIISSMGWYKTSCENNDLRFEKEDLNESLAIVREAYAKVKAENNFYKNLLEEKEDV